MRTIEVPQFGDFDQLQVREVEAPRAGQGELLIDVRAAGINFSDVTSIAGHNPNAPTAPFRPGFEVAGEVAAVGEGVEGWKIGDRAVSALAGGGFSEQVTVATENAVPVPSNIDFAAATALLVQGLTAFYLMEIAPLKPGETVLLGSAAGGVGSLAIQIARIKGAAKVIGLASPRGHERVRELGAEPVNYREDGWSAHVKEFAPKGVDVFLDSIGALDGEGFETLNTGARWMFFSNQSGSQGTLSNERAMKMLFQSNVLHGFFLDPKVYDFGAGLKQLCQWVESGQLMPTVEHRYPLAEVRQAFEDISNRKTHGKVVLEP